MLVVKLELWKKGDPSDVSQLGEIKIINDGTGIGDRGNYDVEIGYSGQYFGKPGPWKRGRVERYERNRFPVYYLLLAALNSALSTYQSRAREAAPPISPVPKQQRSVFTKDDQTTPCKACGKPMLWRKTVKGRPMPLDPEPIEVVKKGPNDGSIGLNLLLEDGEVVVCRRAQPGDEGVLIGRVSHFSTCSSPGTFRKTRDDG